MFHKPLWVLKLPFSSKPGSSEMRNGSVVHYERGSEFSARCRRAAHLERLPTKLDFAIQLGEREGCTVHSKQICVSCPYGGHRLSEWYGGTACVSFNIYDITKNKKLVNVLQSKDLGVLALLVKIKNIIRCIALLSSHEHVPLLKELFAGIGLYGPGSGNTNAIILWMNIKCVLQGQIKYAKSDEVLWFRLKPCVPQ